MTWLFLSRHGVRTKLPNARFCCVQFGRAKLTPEIYTVMHLTFPSSGTLGPNLGLTFTFATWGEFSPGNQPTK